MIEENSLKQPSKKETLAIKQKARIRRFHHLRSRLPELPQEWWIGIGELIGLVTLFLVNLWLLLPFFGQENKTNVFSAPLVPLLATLTERLIPFNYGVRIWLLVFFIIFPLSFYYFVREIAERRLVALLASFFVILPFSVFLQVRVSLGFLGEDGAHIASLTLIPLICLLLLRFLRHGNFWAGVFSSVGMAIVALTSPIGFLTLAVFMGVITFSEMLLGEGRLKLLRFLVVLILAVGFSTFWYNPKFVIATIQSTQGQLIRRTLSNLIPISFFTLPIFGIIGFLLFENQPQLQSMFIASFLTIVFGLFSLGAGIVHPAPSRFLPAFGISLAFLLGVLIIWLFDLLRTSEKLRRFKTVYPYRRLIAFGLISFIFIFFLVMIIFSYQDFWKMEQSRVLGLTADQKVGIWEIKEKTNSTESIFGYTITGLTAIVVVVLKLRLGI